ncbi:hypothetical protein Patl1_22334 [Pistacia atlantica]|uniref:Uncharacterized protein n=1 Tax=Pistacia atlantica TaxID=434234 RepID=A0ACC1A1A3_9ROSI|nr:hypothetical protein Patl1_22334 [Pistacia atlantica]
MEMNKLPEGCVSTIISLTSPADACRSSLVSSSFRSAVESDVVWERFLPSDYQDTISRSGENNVKNFSSKKELFLHFCNAVLIDGGKKSFRLEKSSGKKCFILSARELSITWSDNPEFWIWKSSPESRFAEVAELKSVSKLEIEGKIRTQKLSPNTRYGAYLIMKTNSGAYGLDLVPAETSVEVGSQSVSSNKAYLTNQDAKKQQMECLFYSNRRQMLKPRVLDSGINGVIERKDGWMEIEVGEFFNGESDEMVKMSVREIKGYQLKGGLVIEGIEVRPKK